MDTYKYIYILSNIYFVFYIDRLNLIMHHFVLWYFIHVQERQNGRYRSVRLIKTNALAQSPCYPVHLLLFKYSTWSGGEVNTARELQLLLSLDQSLNDQWFWTSADLWRLGLRRLMNSLHFRDSPAPKDSASSQTRVCEEAQLSKQRCHGRKKTTRDDGGRGSNGKARLWRTSLCGTMRWRTAPFDLPNARQSEDC